MSQYRKGVDGEGAAETYLKAKGCITIARRYRAQDGEIDLIMDDGGTVVFVEVKNRQNSPAGTGLLAVTPDKMRRMSHAALAFLYEKGWTDRSCRFDVVEISRNGIKHIPNAFDTAK